MRYDDDESFAGLDQAPRGRGPRRRWTGTPSQRASAARRSPQAIFKISSWSHSAGAVAGRFEYISREGEVEVEGRDGERLDPAALEARAGAWGEEAEARHTRRVSMSAMVSFPGDVDEEKARVVARELLREAFADNHDYVWAAHSDTKNFHVHFVVQAAGLDGKQLKIGREDLQDLRLRFAEKAAEQGIELDASPRWARGEEKAQAAAPEIEGMLRRWSQPENELAGEIFPSAARRTQLEALVAVRRDRDPEAAVSPLEYARAAELLAGRAREQEDGAERAREINSAVQLARFGLHQSQEPECPAAERAAVRRVVAEVDKAVAGQLREVEDDDERRALWGTRRPLGEELAASRPEPDRPWAREEERERAGPWNECQALEYAQAAGRAAGEIGELPTDRDRVAAIQGVVEMARFGWTLAGKEQGEEEERDRARAIIDKTERTLRATIHEIEDPQAQKEAIQARARLYREGLQEYREERQEERGREREPAQAPERPGGPEIEPAHQAREQVQEPPAARPEIQQQPEAKAAGAELEREPGSAVAELAARLEALRARRGEIEQAQSAEPAQEQKRERERKPERQEETEYERPGEEGHDRGGGGGIARGPDAGGAGREGGGRALEPPGPSLDGGGETVGGNGGGGGGAAGASGGRARGPGRELGGPDPASGPSDSALGKGKQEVAVGLEPERVESAALGRELKRDTERTGDDGLLRERAGRGAEAGEREAEGGAKGSSRGVGRDDSGREGGHQQANTGPGEGDRGKAVEPEPGSARAELAARLEAMRARRGEIEQAQEQKQALERQRELEQKRERERQRERDGPELER